MTKEINNLKFYHIILISMLISPLLVLNSNLNNKQREKERSIRKELNNVFLRKLDFKEDTNSICNKGSDELKEYYKTGDGGKIGIKEGKIENKDDSEHINALINLVSSEGDTMDNAKTYAMHVIPVLVFLVITIFSLPGWLICCFCNCCDCCCCCCCKKTSCKVPFYILTVVIYALVAAICVYGLSQSNSIFVGLADTECSLLRFTGEVLDGETKETKPKWIGISGIETIFTDTKTQIQSLTSTKKQEFVNKRTGTGGVVSKIADFEDAMRTQGVNIKNHYHRIGGIDYQLDIKKQFGTFAKSDSTVTIEPNEPTILMYGWYREFQETVDQGNTYMGAVEQNYDGLAGNSVATKALTDGIDAIKDIKNSFDGIKDQISGIILEYSDMIDEYGKLAFKLVFSVLLIIDVAIAAFITLLCFCSFQACQNCCIRCILKSFLHILWNVLALLTFFTLLLGSIFTLFGTVGKDLISVVEYLVSDENLNKGEEASLVGEAAKYLKKCVNGNGDITHELNLDTSSLNNVDQLNIAIKNIDQVREKIQDIIDGNNGKVAYKTYLQQFNDIINYKRDFTLINTDDAVQLRFSDCRTALNGEQDNIDWSSSCEGRSSTSCDSVASGVTPQTCVDLKTCSNDRISTIYSTSSTSTIDKAAYLNAIVNVINNEKKIPTSTEDSDDSYISIAKSLDKLNTAYNNFLSKENEVLLEYRNAINSLTDIFNNLVGNGNIYSLINCLFIGRNVKILLKNLEKTLGTSFYNVGICLVIAGIAMLVSISFTILLNIIFNQKDTKPGMPGIKQ